MSSCSGAASVVYEDDLVRPIRQVIQYLIKALAQLGQHLGFVINWMATESCRGFVHSATLSVAPGSRSDRAKRHQILAPRKQRNRMSRSVGTRYRGSPYATPQEISIV
jgi:hypothetical protein